MFPDLFLIGAPRSATTWLHAVLASSGDCFSPRDKEPAFFHYRGHSSVRCGRGRRHVDPQSHDLDAYLSLYAARGCERYAIDASTHYLSSPGTAVAIAEASPSAKVIAILRDPVERAWSHYLLGMRDGLLSRSFAEELDVEEREMREPAMLWAEDRRFVRRSLYAAGLRAYADAFSSERLRVYHFENLTKRPDEALADASAFLGISVAANASAEARVNRSLGSESRLGRRAFALYRRSRLRRLVNDATPRSVRDVLRSGLLERRRNPSASKPVLSAPDKRRLNRLLGDDYYEAIELCRQRGVLFENDATG